MRCVRAAATDDDELRVVVAHTDRPAACASVAMREIETISLRSRRHQWPRRIILIPRTHAQADLWALGALIHEMLVGTVPNLKQDDVIAFPPDLMRCVAPARADGWHDRRRGTRALQIHAVVSVRACAFIDVYLYCSPPLSSRRSTHFPSLFSDALLLHARTHTHARTQCGGARAHQGTAEVGPSAPNDAKHCALS